MKTNTMKYSAKPFDKRTEKFISQYRPGTIGYIRLTQHYKQAHGKSPRAIMLSQDDLMDLIQDGFFIDADKIPVKSSFDAFTIQRSTSTDHGKMNFQISNRVKRGFPIVAKKVII